MKKKIIGSMVSTLLLVVILVPVINAQCPCEEDITEQEIFIEENKIQIAEERPIDGGFLTKIQDQESGEYVHVSGVSDIITKRISLGVDLGDGDGENIPQPKLFGWFFFLIHPDCLGCILTALWESIVFLPAAIACIVAVVDGIPGDEIFLCAWAGLSSSSVMAAYAACKAVC